MTHRDINFAPGGYVPTPLRNFRFNFCGQQNKSNSTKYKHIKKQARYIFLAILTLIQTCRNHIFVISIAELKFFQSFKFLRSKLILDLNENFSKILPSFTRRFSITEYFMGICSSQANKPGGSSLPSSPSEYSRNDHIIQPMENSSPSSGPTLGQLHAPSNSFSHPSTPHNSTPYSPPSSHPQPGSPATQSSSPQSAYQNCQSSKSDHSEIEKANNHPIRDDVKVHAVVTGELDHDHNQALRIPLGQVTDEQLVAELADRELSYDSRASQEYDAGEHDKAIKIPLEAVTNDELLFEVDRRRLTLYESIDQDLILETYEFGKELGKGASGVVYACRHYDTHGMYACKVIKKDTKMNDAQSMSTEIEIMKRLRHKNVVAMYELFESPVCLWMILELVDGGDLRSYLSKHRQTYTEAMAAQHLKQILSGQLMK